MGWLCQLKFTP